MLVNPATVLYISLNSPIANAKSSSRREMLILKNLRLKTELWTSQRKPTPYPKMNV